MLNVLRVTLLPEILIADKPFFFLTPQLIFLVPSSAQGSILITLIHHKPMPVNK